jgi:hypothetical protein
MDQTREHDVFDFGVPEPVSGSETAVTFIGPGGRTLTQQVAGVEGADGQAKAARWLRRRQFAESSLRVDVLSALMRRYEVVLPVVVARRLAGRLIAIYHNVLERTLECDGPGAVAVDVPHLEAVTDEGGRRTVRIVRERFDANQVFEAVRGPLAPVIGLHVADLAQRILVRYTLQVWESLFDEEIDAMLNCGTAPILSLATLDKGEFREQSRPWFEEEASELMAAIGEGLQLRRASLADLERLMGLRAPASGVAGAKVETACKPVDCPDLPATIGDVRWVLDEENNDIERAFEWLFLACDLRFETVLALANAYAPTLPRFVAAEVADELIRLRRSLLPAAPCGVDPRAAGEFAAGWLTAGLERDGTASRIASDVLRICTIRLWKRIDRMRGPGWIAALSPEERRKLHLKPEAVYGDRFVEMSGRHFRKVVQEFARSIVESLNLHQGPLEQIDRYLGLQQASGTPDMRLPSCRST